MDEENKELSKVVDQLRMLLVAKEEEIEDLTNQLQAKGTTVPEERDQFAQELEDYKSKASSFEEAIEELKKNGEEKVEQLREELIQKDATIASLKGRLEEQPSIDPEEEERFKEALDKIELLEEELSRIRAEADGRIEELQSELGEKEDPQDRLTRPGEELDLIKSNLLRMEDRSHRLSATNARLKIGTIILGIALCVFIIITMKQRSATPPSQGGIDFITASGEPVLEMEEGPPPVQKEEAALAPEAEPASPEISEETHFKYTVKRGDNLWKICKKELGNANLADLVARENNLKNPRALEVGMTLRLPKDKGSNS